MSAENRLLRSLLQTSARMRGAHATRRAREYFCGFFARLLCEDGFHHVLEVEDIRMRHIRVLLAAIADKSPRTQCNAMSHLRGLIRKAGNAQIRNLLAAGNSSFGIPKSSRFGTKVAMSDPELAALLDSLECPHLRVLLLLERALGLRGLEAVRAGPSLVEWRVRLRSGQDTVQVIYGTKGGRDRWTRVPDRERALAAVEAAIGVLMIGDRLVPRKTLKEAVAWYRNTLYERGVQAHRLRYAFACEAVERYLAKGHPEKEVFALVAMDLGHGDTRGRWVKMIYCRQLFAG